MSAPHAHGLSCSFCGKHQREVRKLIAGPTVYICDRCTEDAWAAAHDGRAPAPVGDKTKAERAFLEAARAWFQGFVDRGHVERQHAMFAALRELYEEDDARVDAEEAGANKPGPLPLSAGPSPHPDGCPLEDL